ncbi:hypothetical protein C7N43_30665, partial [Sphingobacteriales bacterium UPWRP_1]
MKKLYTLIIGVVLLTLPSLISIAQTPQLINYQAIARNASGQALTNQNIALRLTIRQSTAAGTIQYQERHTTTTNAQGLCNVQIGGGTPLSGSFAAITWADAQPKFLQTELDPAGGTAYTNMGAQQLVSVPYALYAKEAATATNDNDTNPTNEIQSLSLAGTTLSLSNGGGSVNLPAGTTYTAGAGIGISGNTITNTAPDQTITLTGAGATAISGAYPNFTVTTPTPADNSPINEIQTLSIAGNTVSLSNGGGSVNLPTYTAGTGISLSGNTIINTAPDQTVAITGGGVTSVSGTYPNFTVTTPTPADNSPTNEIQTLSIAGNTVSLSNGGGNVNLPTYTAGTGISLSGNTITNTAPDQTVAIAGG